MNYGCCQIQPTLSKSGLPGLLSPTGQETLRLFRESGGGTTNNIQHQREAFRQLAIISKLACSRKGQFAVCGDPATAPTPQEGGRDR